MHSATHALSITFMVVSLYASSLRHPFLSNEMAYVGKVVVS